ncbi:MAG: ABC transporter permease [Bacteroidales bacterium]|nr:ABC transporter permease [Bacteroidales bacterium]
MNWINNILNWINNFVIVWFNEYKVIFKDTGVITLFIIAIFIYPLIYSFAYNNELAKDIPIAIVDQDNSELSRKLITMIDASDEVKITFVTPNFQEAKIKFKKSNIHGIIHIPKDFDNKILGFETAVVSVYADASYMIIYKQIVTAATYSVGTMSAGVEIIRRTAKGDIIEEAMLERDPLPIESYALYNPKGGYATYVMPAVFIMILQQTLFLGIGLLGGTFKEKGYDKLLIPIGLKKGGTTSIVFGKSLAYFSIYILNTAYVVVIVSRMFSLPMRGSFVDVFIFLIPFIFAAIYLGQTIASFFKKREHALMALLFTSIPIVFLSGFSWPIDAMPRWQVWISQLFPSTPGIKGYLAITMRGAHFSDVFYNWMHIWALLIIYFISANLLIKKLFKKIHNTEIDNIAKIVSKKDSETVA